MRCSGVRRFRVMSVRIAPVNLDCLVRCSWNDMRQLAWPRRWPQGSHRLTNNEKRGNLHGKQALT